MSDTDSAVSLLPEFTSLHCVGGLPLAHPPFYGVSDLGNRFLHLVYWIGTLFLTQIIHLLNSILCKKLCYAQYSVCMHNTGSCVLWETWEYLLVWNVLAALKFSSTMVAECYASDYKRLLLKKTLLCKGFVHRNKIQSSVLFTEWKDSPSFVSQLTIGITTFKNNPESHYWSNWSFRMRLTKKSEKTEIFCHCTYS